MSAEPQGSSRGRRLIITILVVPAVFIVSWVMMSLAVWITPAFWTWGEEPTVLEWIIRGIYLAAPFVITVVVGWRMALWVRSAG